MNHKQSEIGYIKSMIYIFASTCATCFREDPVPRLRSWHPGPLFSVKVTLGVSAFQVLIPTSRLHILCAFDAFKTDAQQNGLFPSCNIFLKGK